MRVELRAQLAGAASPSACCTIACCFHDALLYSILIRCIEVSARIPKWPSLSTPSARYNSPRRREQAAATRREILEAAQRLFERQGYAATTMAAIAAEAGVALKTVYVAFETKSGVLRALWNLRLRGDEERRPGRRARPGTARCSTSPTPSASSASTRATRAPASTGSARSVEVIRAAAPTDPEIEALWERIQADYHANQRGDRREPRRGRAR